MYQVSVILVGLSSVSFQALWVFLAQTLSQLSLPRCLPGFDLAGCIKEAGWEGLMWGLWFLKHLPSPTVFFIPYLFP